VVLKLIAIKGGNWVPEIDTLLIVSIPYDSGIDTYRYQKLGISAKPVYNYASHISESNISWNLSLSVD
jgi:hypothetical protein